jgi:hypothetical protein
MWFTKQTMNKISKRNKILLFTKQNETKRNFADFIVSRNKQNFAKQFCCFALFRVSRNKKRMRNGNPTSKTVQKTSIQYNIKVLITVISLEFSSQHANLGPHPLNIQYLLHGVSNLRQTWGALAHTYILCQKRLCAQTRPIGFFMGSTEEG